MIAESRDHEEDYRRAAPHLINYADSLKRDCHRVFNTNLSGPWQFKTFRLLLEDIQTNNELDELCEIFEAKIQQEVSNDRDVNSTSLKRSGIENNNQQQCSREEEQFSNQEKLVNREKECSNQSGSLNSINFQRCTFSFGIHYKHTDLYHRNLIAGIIAAPRLKTSEDHPELLSTIKVSSIPATHFLLHCQRELRPRVISLIELPDLFQRKVILIQFIHNLEFLTSYEWEEIEYIITTLEKEIQTYIKAIEINSSTISYSHSPVPKNIKNSGFILYICGVYPSNYESGFKLYKSIRKFFDVNRDMSQYEDGLSVLSNCSLNLHDIPSSSLSQISLSQTPTNSSKSLSNQWRKEGLVNCLIKSQWHREGVHRCNYFPINIIELIRVCPNHIPMSVITRVINEYIMYNKTVERVIEKEKGEGRELKDIDNLPVPNTLRMVYTFYLDRVGSRLFETANGTSNDGTLEDRAGGKDYKFGSKKLRQVVRDLDFAVYKVITNPSLYTSQGIYPSPRVLLYGPTGAGKSQVLKYMSQIYSNIPLHTIQISSLYSPYLGQSEKNIRDVFKKARRSVPCVVVLEGLDQLAKARNMKFFKGSSNKVVKREGGGCVNEDSDIESDGGDDGDDYKWRMMTSLLLCLDAVDVSDKSGVELGIIGVSSLPPSKLEQSVIRPGRLERWIKMEPCEDER